MANQRSRKNKEHPNYQFLVSWKPSGSHVKGEQAHDKKSHSASFRHIKSADSLAQDAKAKPVKRELVKSLILISLILILELVVYLAWKRFLS